LSQSTLRFKSRGIALFIAARPHSLRDLLNLSSAGRRALHHHRHRRRHTTPQAMAQFGGAAAAGGSGFLSITTRARRLPLRALGAAAAAGGAGVLVHHHHRRRQLDKQQRTASPLVAQPAFLIPRGLADVICGAVGEIVQVHGWCIVLYGATGRAGGCGLCAPTNVWSMRRAWKGAASSIALHCHRAAHPPSPLYTPPPTTNAPTHPPPDPPPPTAPGGVPVPPGHDQGALPNHQQQRRQGGV